MTVDAGAEAPGAAEASGRRGRTVRLPRVERVPRAEPSARTILVSYVLSLLSLLLVCVILNLTVISQFQHWTAQRKLYSELRYSIAAGSTPVGQTDNNNRLVVPGTPVALLQIPKLGINEVVVEGTTSEQTKIAVGHRRDTPLPGQPGVSVLMGRQAAYGGVFSNIGDLRAGDAITITTGEGVAHYRVIGPRVANEKLPALTSTQGRLVLETASGIPFLATGVLMVDADLVSKPFGENAPVTGSGGLQDNEKAMAGDDDSAVGLSWLMELLVLLAVLSVVAWKRWDKRAAWIVFLPMILATSLACADRVCDLLPNLL